MIAEADYSINFTEAGNKFCSSLNYNESNNYLFVNRVKMYQFKKKDYELINYPFWTKWIGYAYNFSVDFKSIKFDDILHLHKYLMNQK